MVDDTQSTNTAQGGSSPSTGGALQPLAQNGLQPQSDNSLQIPGGSNLQQTSAQSIDAINQLDRGSAAINLNTISNTTTTTTQVTATKTVNTKPLFIYAGAGLLVVTIMGYMTYRLMRPQ
jgi:hypothetical protein